MPVTDLMPWAGRGNGAGTQRGRPLISDARPNVNHHCVGVDGVQTPGNLAPAPRGDWRDIVLMPLLAVAFEYWNRSEA